MGDDYSDIWQHVKTGGLYRIEDVNALIEADCTHAVAYRSLADGQLWVRPAVEFFDGRFQNMTKSEIAAWVAPAARSA